MSVLNNTAPIKVLTVKSNTALPAAGVLWDTLAVGQLAAINRDGLTIDDTFTASNREFQLIVTADLDGDSVVEHIFRSGWHQRSKVVSYTLKCFSAHQEKIMQLINVCGECNSSYTLTMNINSNKQYSWRGMALNQVSYTISTDCCEDGNCVEVVRKLRNEINNDLAGAFTAEAIAVADKDNVGATALDDAALDALDPSVEPCPAVLRVRMKPEVEKIICNEPNHAPAWNGFTMHISGADECCGGDIETLQELHIGTGSGYEAREVEKDAIGYEHNGPHFIIADGIPVSHDYQTDVTKKYIYVSFTTADEVNTGMEQFTNHNTTVLLIECAHGTIRDSILAFLDAAFSPFGMEELADDAAECGCSDVQEVSSLGVDLDGIALRSKKSGKAEKVVKAKESPDENG